MKSAKEFFNPKTNKDVPCKDCKDRYVGCHGDCTSYIAYTQKRLQEKKKVSEAKHRDNILYGGIPTKRKKQR